jgi:hypothetical protein
MNTLATDVRFDPEKMWVTLHDGRELGVPLSWFPRLARANAEERQNFKISAFGLHWSDLDEDISVQGLLEGRGANENAA